MADTTTQVWNPSYYGIELEPALYACYLEVLDQTSDPLHLKLIIINHWDKVIGKCDFYYKRYETHRGKSGEDLYLQGYTQDQKTKEINTKTIYWVIVSKSCETNLPGLPYHDEPRVDDKGHEYMESVQQSSYDEPRLQSLYSGLMQIKGSD